MRLFKRFMTLMRLQKHGCTLHFEHKRTKKAYAFEIPQKAFRYVSKMLQKKHDYLFIDNNHHLELHRSLESIEEKMMRPYIELGEVYIGERPYVVINRKLFMDYLDGYKETRNQSSRTILPKDTAESSKSSSIEKETYNKERFDWHDHYLEGLRIHGNKDDAEAHADAMRREVSGKAHT